MVKNILPIPNDDFHLKSVGYSIKNKKTTRHNSLRKASKKVGTLRVLKRLNLIRNLTKNNTKNKVILSDDVDYMKKMYKKQSKDKKGTKKGTKKGGKRGK
jgi:hypothetical protein